MNRIFRALLPLGLLPFAAFACGDDDAPATSGGSDAGAETSATSCTAAYDEALGPVASVSTGEVKVLGTDGATKTIFVDATAGGMQGSATNPRVYVNLDTGTRVDVSDVDARSSTAWDLAIKRPILFANGGDGGPGQGGAALVDKDFAAVTAADVPELAPESFFDAECTAKKDATNALLTSFDGWYDYAQSGNRLSPRAGTWIVKGGSGKVYKLRVLSYYANPDGTTGDVSARYTLEVAPLGT